MVNQLIVSALFGMIAFWGAFQLYPRVFFPPPAEEEALSLDQTMVEIKRELAEIASTPGETAGLVLETVNVELSAQRQSEDGTDVALVVPVFEETKLTALTATKLTRGSKITVAFSAPAGDQLLAQGTQGVLDLSDLVLAARRALLATSESDPKLLPKSVEIELNFVLVKSKSGGGRVKAYVIEIGGKSDQIDTAGNKIVLKYINPRLVEKPVGSAPSKPVPPI